jgi:hypothetical protein
MAQLVEACVGVGAQEDHGQQCNEDKLGDAQFRVASFKLQEWDTSLSSSSKVNELSPQ